MKVISLWKYTVCRRLCIALGLCMLFCIPGLVHTQPAGAVANMSYIRVIHASPDIGTVDVFVDGKKMLSSFQYATVTDYVPLAPGTHKVQLALIGKGVNAASVTQELSVQAGTPYTIAALGTNKTGFSFSVFTDDNTIVGTGSKIRIYHLSPGTGAAQVTTPTTAIVNNLTYAHASSYIPLSSGVYTVSLISVAQHATLSAKVTLASWTVMSIFAIGLEQGNPHWRIITLPQQGLPGMPQTGSDPNTVVAAAPFPWSFCILVVSLVGLLAGSLMMLARIYPGYAGSNVAKKQRKEQSMPDTSFIKEG